MHQIFYVTVDPERALGVEDLIPSYHIIHSEQSQITQPLETAGIDIKQVSSPEQSTSKLLENETVKKYIHTHAHETPDILVFKNDATIASTAQQNGFNLINPGFTLSKKFENKIEFAQFVATYPVFSTPDQFIIDKLSDLTFDAVRKISGSTGAVVQFMFGHSGNSTFYIHSEQELKELQRKYPSRKAKIAAYVEGVPYTINACITRKGIVIGGISEQITGIDFLTSSKGGTVGNDFTQRHLTNDLRTTLIQKTIEIGKIFQKEGHRGIFGLDVILGYDNQFYIIEANMRQTMSCAYFSYLQRQNENAPIMLWHVLELLNHDWNKDIQLLDPYFSEIFNKDITGFVTGDQLDYNLRINQPIQASQVFFRNIYDHSIKIHDPFPAGIYRMRGRMPEESAAMENGETYSAIFRLREDGFSSLCHIRRGYNILQAVEEEGFLITYAAENAIIPPLGEIGRIQLTNSAFTAEMGNELQGWIKDTVLAIYENSTLEHIRA